MDSIKEKYSDRIDEITDGEGNGTVISKMIKNSKGNSNGPYAYHVSPPSEGREWTYLGLAGDSVGKGSSVNISDYSSYDFTGDSDDMKNNLENMVDNEILDRYNIKRTEVGDSYYVTLERYNVDDSPYTDSIGNEIVKNIQIDNKDGKLKVHIPTNYNEDSMFEKSFDIDEDNLNEKIHDAIKDAHKINTKRVSDEKEKILNNYESISEKDVGKLVWNLGQQINIENESAPELLEKFEISDNTAYEISNFETEYERRYSQNDPEDDLVRFVNKIPNMNSNASENISNEYISREKINNSTISELTDISGVGKKTAEKLKWYVDKDNNTTINKKISDDKTVSRVDKLKNIVLDNELVSDVSYGKNNMKRRGLFYSKDAKIRMKNDLEKGGFEMKKGGHNESYEQVLAHEIAHTFEDYHKPEFGDTGGTFDASEVIENLSDDAQKELEYFHRFEHGDSRTMPHERFTNYFSSVVAEPEKTREMLPTASKEFEEEIIKQSSGTRKEVLEQVFNDEL